MSFEFTSPQTLDDALQLYHDRARWFAGGTDLVPEIKTGTSAPARLVNLKQIAELRGIEETGEGLRIGGLTTLTEIAESRPVREKCRALADACEFSASPQLRHVATIGGNLNQDSRCPYYRGGFYCWLKGGATCYMRGGESREAAIIGYHDCVHVHPSDPAAALVALDAKIGVRGKNGAREIAAEVFFRAPAGDNRRLNVLPPDEVITHLQIPISSNSRSVYLKAMDRATWTFALVSAAARLDFTDGKISDARVVIGGIAPVPWRAREVEILLQDQVLNADLAARAAEQAIQDAEPLAHNAYKIRLARALVKRAIVQIL